MNGIPLGGLVCFISMRALAIILAEQHAYGRIVRGSAYIRGTCMLVSISVTPRQHAARIHSGIAADSKGQIPKTSAR